MKFCPVCSRKLDDEAMVCPNCHTELGGVKEKSLASSNTVSAEEWNRGTIFVDAQNSSSSNGESDNYTNNWGRGTVFADQNSAPYPAPVMEERKIRVDNEASQKKYPPVPNSYQSPTNNGIKKKAEKKKAEKVRKEKPVKEEKLDTVTLVVRIVLIAIIVIVLLLGVASVFLK